MLEIETVTSGPIPKYVQSVCHDTLPRLISFLLDVRRLGNFTDYSEPFAVQLCPLRVCAHFEGPQEGSRLEQ
jgi:hypothetical protein